MTEHRAKLAALAVSRRKKRPNKPQSAATVRKLEATIPVLQQRVEIRKTYGKGARIEAHYLEMLQLLFEQQQELSVQKSRLRETEAAVAAMRETQDQAIAEYSRTLSDELAKSEQKANGLAQDLIKAERGPSCSC